MVFADRPSETTDPRSSYLTKVEMPQNGKGVAQGSFLMRSKDN
jgi:hypothetical protein